MIDNAPSPGPATELPFMDLQVAAKAQVATDTWCFTLRDLHGAALPLFTAGAHLTVQTPAGMRRNYSLCSDPFDRSLYQIGVKRDGQGRGGSVSMADDLQEGDIVAASAPRNNFELDARAGEFLFIAGGIGITPILSMMRALQRSNRAPFRLIYCTRDEKSTAFRDELQTEFGPQLQLHHDHGDLDNALDLWHEFELPGRAHVYCCGPRGLMEAVADMSGHWPSGAIHFESFGADSSQFEPDVPFTVRLHHSGKVIPVAADQSILEALRAAGQQVPSSCESGTCGTCRTGLLSGDAEHRDMVLLDEEKADQIMVCVSRAHGGELVLDL